MGTTCWGCFLVVPFGRTGVGPGARIQEASNARTCGGSGFLAWMKPLELSCWRCEGCEPAAGEDEAGERHHGVPRGLGAEGGGSVLAGLELPSCGLLRRS